VDNPTSTFPGATTLDLNFLSEKFICRKVCEDTEKFEKTHCTFEIQVLKVTDQEGKIQGVKNYHTAHKDDYSFYNSVLYAANKNRDVLPLSANV
jgi:hypothetical protein